MSSSPTRPPFGGPSNTTASSTRPADAKAAVGELLTELEVTRKEYAKLSIQLTQLDAELQQSKDVVQQQSDTIGALEQQVVQRDEDHRTAMREAEDRYVTKDAALAHRTRHLELEVQRLQAENEHMAKVEADNRSLREGMLDLQAMIEKLQIVNEDLRQRTKDGASGAAFEDLEKEFQKKLAAAEKKFRAEAYRALSEEAKIALQGNDHLQNVLKRQNDSIELVLQRCKTLESSHGLMQSQQDRSAVEMEQQIREVNRLTKALEETRSKNQQLDEAMRQRRVERASLELLFVEYEATRKKLAKAEEKSRRSTREAERWKNRAVQLTQELNDEQREVAERRLLQLQSMSDTVESNAVRDEYRTDLKQRIQAKAQQGSLAYQFATGSGGIGGPLTSTSVDNPYGFVDSNASRSQEAIDFSSTNGATAQQATIKPMDILSIWNKKYGDGFEQNVDATVSGRDLVTSAEADKILEGIRAGVSPLALTANKNGMDGDDALLLANGGGHTPPPNESLATARPTVVGPPSHPNPNNGANPLSSSIANNNGASSSSALGSSAVSRRSMQQGSGAKKGNATGALPAVSANGHVLGANDGLVAEKNRQLSVLSQSHSLHMTSGSTARLPPSFQNNHRNIAQNGGGNNKNPFMLSKDGATALISGTSISSSGHNMQGTHHNTSGGIARSGSALGSRNTIHQVTSDGEMKVIPPNKSVISKKGSYAHPNPPQISPSTMAQIQQREQQQQLALSVNGGVKGKIAP